MGKSLQRLQTVSEEAAKPTSREQPERISSEEVAKQTLGTVAKALTNEVYITI
jgi:hypothetical protein